MMIKRKERNSLHVLRSVYFRKPWHVVYNIKQLLRAVKYAKQRITRGFSDADLWGLGDYYVDLIYESLGEFIKDLHGYPIDTTEEEWNEYLNRMREHFYNASFSNESNYASILISEAEDRFLSASSTKEEKIEEARKNLMEVCTAAYEFREQELHEGMKMLEERIFNLWD